MPKNSLILLMGLIVAGFAPAEASAQAQDEEGRVEVYSSPQEPQGEFSPFLPQGSNEAFKRPRYSHGGGGGADGAGAAKSDFDFDTLMTPGARGSKRSLGHTRSMERDIEPAE